MLPHQTSPLYECVGYRAPAFQLVIHLQRQRQGDLKSHLSHLVSTETFLCRLNTYQTPDCQQVLPRDGVSAWTRDLSHSQREAQEHKHTQTLYLQLKQPFIIFLLTIQCVHILLWGGGWCSTSSNMHKKENTVFRQLSTMATSRANVASWL